MFRISIVDLSILGILTYFSGWWYWNTYLSTFGINRSSITSPDFTVVLHAYSAISAIPFMISTRQFELFPSFVCVSLIFIGFILRRCITKRLSRVFILRIWSWLLLFVAVHSVSNEAGQIDAKYVLDGCGRVVEILSNPTLHRAKENTGEGNNRRLYNIFEESSDGMVVLLWRNSTETILFHYTGDTDDDGRFRGGEAWRIDNEIIGGIAHHVSNYEPRTFWDVSGIRRKCSRE